MCIFIYIPIKCLHMVHSPFSPFSPFSLYTKQLWFPAPCSSASPVSGVCADTAMHRAAMTMDSIVGKISQVTGLSHQAATAPRISSDQHLYKNTVYLQSSSILCIGFCFLGFLVVSYYSYNVRRELPHHHQNSNPCGLLIAGKTPISCAASWDLWRCSTSVRKLSTVSIGGLSCGGFHKWTYPKWMGFNGKTIYKWIIWGYPYFRKPPCRCFTNQNQATSHTPRRCRQDAHDIQTLGAEARSQHPQVIRCEFQALLWLSNGKGSKEKSISTGWNLRKVKTVEAALVDFCSKIDEEVIGPSRCKQYLMKPFLLLRTHTSWQSVTLRMIIAS